MGKPTGERILIPLGKLWTHYKGMRNNNIEDALTFSNFILIKKKAKDL
jgi:hypothetical protein